MTVENKITDKQDMLWVVTDRVRFLGRVPGHNLEMVEVQVPPGSGTPPHSHDSGEMFYVAEGELTVRQFPTVGAPPKTAKLGPGETVQIAPKVPHMYVNESDFVMRMIVLIEPEMIAFFRDIGTSEPQASPDFERMGAAMERHGIQVLEAAA